MIQHGAACKISGQHPGGISLARSREWRLAYQKEELHQNIGMLWRHNARGISGGASRWHSSRGNAAWRACFSHMSIPASGGCVTSGRIAPHGHFSDKKSAGAAREYQQMDGTMDGRRMRNTIAVAHQGSSGRWQYSTCRIVVSSWRARRTAVWRRTLSSPARLARARCTRTACLTRLLPRACRVFAHHFSLLSARLLCAPRASRTARTSPCSAPPRTSCTTCIASLLHAHFFALYSALLFYCFALPLASTMAASMAYRTCALLCRTGISPWRGRDSNTVVPIAALDVSDATETERSACRQQNGSAMPDVSGGSCFMVSA